jgi:hypothetical protein
MINISIAFFHNKAQMSSAVFVLPVGKAFCAFEGTGPIQNNMLGINS